MLNKQILFVITLKNHIKNRILQKSFIQLAGLDIYRF